MRVSTQVGRRVWRIAFVVLLLTTLFAVQFGANAASDDELRLAGPAQGPEVLDPAQLRDLSATTIFRQIFRGLVYYDDQLNPVPELAESWAVSADGLVYQFVLREAATFQNGDPIEASDVAYSLSRAVNPDSTNGDLTLLAGPAFLSDIAGFAEVARGEQNSLSGIEVISDRELTITLSAPRSTFLMKLASIPASIVDRDQIEADAAWWTNPNGSGPFALDEWDPGNELILKRYDDFVLGRPEIETIYFRLGARSQQSFNLYQADEIDVDSVSLYDIDRVADPDGEFANELIITPQFAFGYIALNANAAPLDDPEIRMALQLAFPRGDFAAITYDGWVNSIDGLIPAGMLDRDWPAQLPPQNLDAARAAIASSTYGSAENVPPIRIYSSGAIAAEVLRAVAKEELGLTIEVFNLEWYDMLDRLDARELPAFELFWAADYPDPEAILLSLWGSASPDNYTGYGNDVVDGLLAEAAQETDVDARAMLYDQVNGEIAQDNVVIPFFQDVQYTVVKDRVNGLVVTPIGILRLETVQIES